LKLKLDLHVHTNRSRDAITPPEQLARLCKERGLDGLAITDHNILSSDKSQEIVILPGIEISSRHGHIIGLGISETIPRGLAADLTIQRIKDLNGVSIIAHPYDILRPAIKPEQLTVRPNAIEVINSASFLHSISWKKARKFAERERYPMTGGSDSHIPQTVGRAYTEIECESKDTQSILKALKSGSALPYGRPIRARERIEKILFRGKT